MEKKTFDIIGAIISIIIGAGLLIFREFLTRFAIKKRKNQDAVANSL